MPNPAEANVIPAIEGLHLVCLAVAASALFLGLVADQLAWVKGGIALVILLPPLRLATSIIGEARARRYGVAAMGALVLVFLLFSRRLS